jgi:hypothetical protein
MYAGLFKSNIAPMLLDQDTQTGLVVKELKTGERVILDPEVTAQRLVLAYYGLVNVGAFFGLATTYAEKDGGCFPSVLFIFEIFLQASRHDSTLEICSDLLSILKTASCSCSLFLNHPKEVMLTPRSPAVGYWLAYALPGIIYLLLPILLALIYKKVIKKPAGNNQLTQFFQVIGIAFKRGGFKKIGRAGFWDAAKPSVLAAEGVYLDKSITWNDGFVEDVQRTIEACQIFLFFPIYVINDGGIGTIQTSQGSSMTTNGAPNDLLNNFNPLTIIVAIPIISYGLYPLLRKYKIHFGPIKRITLGFILAALSAVAGAVTQYYVYQTSPCGYYATGCTVGTGVSPISIWVQVPQYVLGALSECFANVTALELAYARAPRDMKGLVMSMFLFSNALSAAIGEACTPSLNDPNLIWPFAVPAIVGFLLAVWFYYLYRHLDNDEYIREGVSGENESANLVRPSIEDRSGEEVRDKEV